MTTPALSVERLVKRYRTGEGVGGVDLHVERGEVVALLGPNGSGKTTTLRCIVGLLVPDAGRIVVCGARPGSIAAQRATCFIADTPDLYPALTIEEHLRFRAQAFGLAAPVDERLARALAELGLSELSERLGGELSRGQRQRTMLAAALLQNAALYLLDEPTVGLDPPGTRWLAEWLRGQAALGAAVVVATHNLDFVTRTADRVVLMRAGESIATEVVPREHGARDEWEETMIDQLGSLEPHA
jgi:ABC-2 type transport system ATP-binding protein